MKSNGDEDDARPIVVVRGRRKGYGTRDDGDDGNSTFFGMGPTSAWRWWDVKARQPSACERGAITPRNFMIGAFLCEKKWKYHVTRPSRERKPDTRPAYIVPYVVS